MSLYDDGNPQHLRYLEDHRANRERREKAAPKPTDRKRNDGN